MRAAGFPCRVNNCDRAFQVVDQTSMSALTAASDARSAHEVADHDYHHVRLGEGATRVWGQRTNKRPATP